MPEETQTRRESRDPLLPATMWSAVLQAREADAPHALQALERLARAY